MDKVQMRALVTTITQDGTFSPKDIFWTTPERAKHYIENKIAETITPVAKPEETKIVEPEVKKSSPGTQDGRLTDSVPSGVSGAAALSSASRVGQALPQSNARRSTLTLPKKS